MSRPEFGDLPDHFPLGPSSSKRWVNCPGSLKVPYPEEEGDNEAADRGTLGHALTEAILRGEVLAPEYTAQYDAMSDADKFDLSKAVADCVEVVKHYAKSASIMWLETKIPDDLISNHGGTVDVILVYGDTLHVIDYKFGRVPVEAEGNTQLQCYLNLARQLLPEPSRFFGTIVQPYQDGEDTVEFSRDDLEAFYLRVLHAAESSEFRAGDHCTYCPLMAQCETLGRYIRSEVDKFPELRVLTAEVEDVPTNEQMAILAKIYRVGKIAADMAEGAGTLIKRYHRKGADIESHGLGVRVSNRGLWKDGATPVLIERASQFGISAAEVTTPPKPIAPGTVRKALDMSKEDFETTFQDVLTTTPIESLVIGKSHRGVLPEFD